ncbi:MAG TPA: hypothetical protein VNM90_09310 [Haliangium sp.]|nr:hypothetical protein [Haliangium sp.]
MNKLASAALFAFTLLAFPLVPACTDDDGGAAEDLEMTAEDFECILDWPKVDRFRILNKLGHQEEAEAVARAADGGVYPVGTVIQLIPFEAMVKRHEGWNPATGDWEFFMLDVSADGTTIAARGGEEVKNPMVEFTCLDCHSQAEPKFDMVCNSGHGCDPLPFTPEQIEAVQQSDPRCQQ